MNIIHNISEITDKPKVITIGNFDGVHRGHQSLIKTTRDIADKNGVESLVFTFSKLPEEVFEKKDFNRLTDNDLKFSYIKKFNIDNVLSIDFSEIREYSAKFFCEEILINKLNIKYLVIGHNFKFGKDREGSIDNLREYHNRRAFELVMPELEKYDNKINISSTLIRTLLKEGKFFESKKCLGRDYELHGIIKSGEKLGRKLGYPTANISLEYNYPLDGIYLSQIMIDGKYYSALSSVGNKPTYNGKEKLLEVFILDFNEDIYGKYAKVFFYEKIRNQIKFNNQDELIKQMNEDHKYAIINSKKYGI
tara:strand:- start:1966 stop:2886 length:921 start_codon:yes stop_codon:yes gene_type:complete